MELDYRQKRQPFVRTLCRHKFFIGDYMPAKKDFVEWFTKMFPHSCIDSDHARSCLAGWNAAEEKLTAHNKQSTPCCDNCGYPLNKNGKCLTGNCMACE